MQLIAEYRPQSDDFDLTDEKDLHMGMNVEEMDTLRETVCLALADRFQHTGRIQ